LIGDSMPSPESMLAIMLVGSLFAYVMKRWIGAIIFILWYTVEQLFEYFFHVYVTLRFVAFHSKAKAHDIRNEIAVVAINGAEEHKLPAKAELTPSADEQKPDASEKKPFEAWAKPAADAEKNVAAGNEMPSAEKGKPASDEEKMVPASAPLGGKQAALESRARELAAQRSLKSTPSSVKKAATEGKRGKPLTRAEEIEAKRAAAREYMRKKRAMEKAKGIPKAVLAHRREMNRIQMRRLRAKMKRKQK
jgi:hypothetical protein